MKVTNLYVISWQDEDGNWQARWVRAANDVEARHQGYSLSLGAFVYVQRAQFVIYSPPLRLAA